MIWCGSIASLDGHYEWSMGDCKDFVRGRFSTHLACDSSPSEAVVELLLQQPGGKDLASSDADSLSVGESICVSSNK